MKKRNLLKKLLATTLCVFALSLTACGGSSGSSQTSMSDEQTSSSTMTVSEMLEQVISDSENGKVRIYRYKTNEKSDLVSDSFRMYEFDGTNLDCADNGSDYTLEQIVTGKADLTMIRFANNVELEFKKDTDGYKEYLSGNSGIYFYDTFSHIDIAGKSFMCFSYTGEEYSKTYVYYVLIQDTKSTKNKTIVYDTTLEAKEEEQKDLSNEEKIQ